MSGTRRVRRRPIADIFRRTADTATRFCVRHGIHPDTISRICRRGGVRGGNLLLEGLEIRWLLIIAPLFSYLRLWFNMLDGWSPSLLQGEPAWRDSERSAGSNLGRNHFCRRRHSGLMNPISVTWAAIAALLTAYVGLFDKRLAFNANSGNYVQPVANGCALHRRVGRISSIDLSAGSRFWIWTCFIVIAGCVKTIVVRLKRITAALQDKRVMSPQIAAP